MFGSKKSSRYDDEQFLTAKTLQRYVREGLIKTNEQLREQEVLVPRQIACMTDKELEKHVKRFS